MRKKLIIFGSIVILILIGVYFVIQNNKDAIKFKKEYEKLNDEKTGYGKRHMAVSINSNNPVKYVTFNELMEILDNGTGIIYFGFPECPWCRTAVPVLLEAAAEMEIDNVYYFNAKEMRDEKKIKDGKIVTNKKGTKEYYKLIEKLDDILPPYSGLEDENIKRLYFPTVVFIRGGTIVDSHMDTVSSQKDPYKKLSKEQRKELLKTYEEKIEKIYGICDESC